MTFIYPWLFALIIPVAIAWWRFLRGRPGSLLAAVALLLLVTALTTPSGAMAPAVTTWWWCWTAAVRWRTLLIRRKFSTSSVSSEGRMIAWR